jgi:ATP-binding cassette, subfamily B, bacterial PglK
MSEGTPVHEKERAPVIRLLALLPRAERRAGLGVLAVSLLTALFETAGVASILPFMAVVMDPEVLDRAGPISSALRALGAETPRQATIIVGAATIALIGMGNAAAATNIWVQERFLARVQTVLITELFRGYMRQPYLFHTQRDAASLTKVMFADVGQAVHGFLNPIVFAISKGLIAILLLGLVVAQNVMVAMGTALLMGGSYWLIYRLVRNRQVRLGEELSSTAVERHRTGLEGLGGVKELRVLGREGESLGVFERASRRNAQVQAVHAMMSRLPRHLIEVVAFGGVVGITLALLAVGDVRTAVPALALYAFAGYRLMPALQQVYAGAVALRFNHASVASLEADLDMLRSGAGHLTETLPADGIDETPLHFRQVLELRNVTFRYPGVKKPALSAVSIKVHRRESIGLVGRTGAGKTTLADLLLGLYPPSEGELLVDGVCIDNTNVRSWRSRVGYVPQSVFLANASIAQNIAFGLSIHQIDRDAVERAARMAQADEFISELPQGYDTLVGERGVRLSGGQRQRLGIARALYHDPDVLVFDEATSALDGMTEDMVMDAVRSLSRGRTVILIAHRLRTVEACDRILMLEEGNVIADGPYEELARNSKPFRGLMGRGGPSVAVAG